VFDYNGEVHLTEEDYKLIDHAASQDFPWYFSGSVDGEDFIQPCNYWAHGFFTHNLILRQKNIEYETYPEDGTDNSYYYKPFMSIFERFCFMNGIEVNNIFRSALNHTVYSADVEDGSNIHFDHNFPHKIFILYLSDFTGGETVLYDKDNNEIERSIPKKYNAVLFDGKHPHRQLFCNKGERRIIFLVTFN
jgi:hypothetical protein